ncbi:MAG: hypothetical protein ACU85U_16940 [Gammaproteobacteria bacterium]
MDIDTLVNRLRPLAQSVEQRPAGDEFWWDIRFPAVPGADYRFRACVYEDGDASVGANRIGAPEDEYFWYLAFEAVVYDEPEDLFKDVLEIVECLLSHDTRIIQSVNLVSVGFECLYADDNGWHSVGGNGALRLGFNSYLPKIDGKEKEYRAPAVRPGGEAQ